MSHTARQPPSSYSHPAGLTSSTSSPPTAPSHSNDMAFGSTFQPSAPISTSPPPPAAGASVKRHHTLAGGAARSNPPTSGGNRLSRLQQDDWRRKDNQVAVEGGNATAGGEEDDVVVLEDYESADRVLGEERSSLFRQASLPTGSIATRGFGSNQPSSLSRQSSTSTRSARAPSFSSTGAAAPQQQQQPPPSSYQHPATTGSSAAAAATAAGGIGRSSSLRNAMGKPDWRMAFDEVPASGGHQRSYSTSSPLLASGALKSSLTTGSLGRSSSIKSVGGGGHVHTKSMHVIGSSSPPIQLPTSSSAAAAAAARWEGTSPTGGQSINSPQSAVGGSPAEEYTDDLIATDGAGGVRRTHSLQHGYGQNSKIQERLARSPALFPPYQRPTVQPSSLGQTSTVRPQREDEPPTSPIRRSPWDATSVTPENDGWAELNAPSSFASMGQAGSNTRTRDQLTTAFEAMQLSNEMLGAGGGHVGGVVAGAGQPSQQMLYQMAMQESYGDLRGRSMPAGGQQQQLGDYAVDQSGRLAQRMPPVASTRTSLADQTVLSPILQSRSHSRQAEGRAGTPGDQGQQQQQPPYPSYPGQAGGNYIDLSEHGESGRFTPQHQTDNRWQPQFQQFNQMPGMQGQQQPGMPPVMAGGGYSGQQQTFHAPYPQTAQYYQQFAPGNPPEPVKIPDAVASKAAADVQRMVERKNLNPTDFDCEPVDARFFVIKSFTEDDVHKSLKHDIWASTTFGNQRLDKAFQESKGPVYLFFSVNGSGHFCGVAQMTSAVDYNKTSTVWAQDKWKGIFSVKWIFVRDIPNAMLRHIRLLNTQEQKPITNSRDTQELLPEAGIAVLKMFATYKEKTSLLEDFGYYEMQAAKRALQEASGDPNAIIRETPSEGGHQAPIHVARIPPQAGMVKGFNPAGPPSLAPSRFAVVGGSMNGRGGLRGGLAR